MFKVNNKDNMLQICSKNWWQKHLEDFDNITIYIDKVTMIKTLFLSMFYRARQQSTLSSYNNKLHVA